MLNEAPKKPKKSKDFAHPTKSQLFWRTQKEGLRRMVTPSLMYFFMSLIMLSCQAISAAWAQISIGIVCILIGGFFNAHLCYHYGVFHYGEYVAGCLMRKNELFGVEMPKSHRVEREYRPWKGFYIGFLIGVPVILLGLVAGFVLDTAGQWALILLTMFDGWAIMPVSWVRQFAPNMAQTSWLYSILMIILPILISGISYIAGAVREKGKREAETERNARIEAAREEAGRKVRVQTEEQRKKTLQSKKKK